MKTKILTLKKFAVRAMLVAGALFGVSSCHSSQKVVDTPRQPSTVSSGTDSTVVDGSHGKVIVPGIDSVSGRRTDTVRVEPKPTPTVYGPRPRPLVYGPRPR